MSAIQFANDAQTTLNGDIGSGDASIVVASAAAFPGSDPFIIQIGSELLLVTAVSGVNWDVTRAIESTVAQAHTSGTNVTLVLTAGFMNTLVPLTADQTANLVFAGPVSGPPAPPSFRAIVAADIPSGIGTGTVTSVGLSLPSMFSVSGSPITVSGTLTATLANQTAHYVLAGPSSGGAAAPSFRGLVFADLPANTGTVFSVGLSLPSMFTVSGSPVTGSGTLTATLANQAANLVLAGPSSGSAAAPTFRALTAADMPGGTGSVSSVGLSLPSMFSVSGSPITSSGTLTGTLANQSANRVLAGPASGSAAAPTFRALTADDLPGGTGTVTSVSVTTANGVSGTVTDPTTTPAITLSLGAITPTSVAATGTVTGSNLMGTNTGDQTITLTGDVTGTGTGSFATAIGSGAVTYAKMQNVSASSLLGNSSGSSQYPAEISLGTNLSFSGSTLNAASPPAAVKADQVAASSTSVFVNPAVQQFHPSAAKAWGYFTVSGTVVTLVESYGVASVTRISYGLYRVTFSTPFTTDRYACFCTADNYNGVGNVLVNIDSRTTSSFDLVCTVANFTTPNDLTGLCFSVHGTQ